MNSDAVVFAHSWLTTSESESFFTPKWYAVHTRSRHEKRVTEECAKRDVETFLPQCDVVRTWKNGRHRVQLPLFAGYTFVRLALRDRLAVLKITGVVRMVGVGASPIPLGNDEIARLMSVVASGLRPEPFPYASISIGRRVRVIAGPLSGIEGTVLRRRRKHSFIISLDLIQRAVAVEVSESDMELVL